MSFLNADIALEMIKFDRKYWICKGLEEQDHDMGIRLKMLSKTMGYISQD
jgi:hypothetical protein